MVQLPCPEQRYFGILRRSMTKDMMDSEEYRSLCREIAEEYVKLAEAYTRAGFKVVCFIGRASSPTCGVRKVWVRKDGREIEISGMGILFEEIAVEMRKRNLSIPLLDLERSELPKLIEELRNLLRS